MSNKTDMSWITAEWLLERRAWTSAKIMEEIGCSGNTVPRLFRRLGVERWRTSNGALKVPREWIEQRVNMTAAQIATELGCSTRSVESLLDKLGIQVKRPQRGVAPSCPCEHEVQCRMLQRDGLPAPCQVDAISELREMGFLIKDAA